jgi:hypothetical protein
LNSAFYDLENPMLDEFRDQAGPYYEEEETYEEIKPRRPKGKTFLGMTPAQRFIIAVLFLCMVCFLGVLVLVVTERVIPPF